MPLDERRNAWWFQVSIGSNWSVGTLDKEEAEDALKFAARMVKVEHGLVLQFTLEEEQGEPN